MLVYLFSAVGAFVIGRITRDTLFLTEWPMGRRYLAHMYYIAPLSVSVCAYLYSRIADRFRRDRLILATTSVLIACLLAGAVALRALESHAFYIGLYIFVEIMGMFLTLQFWTFANDVIDAREGKRLFGVIATGGVLASVVCGQVVQRLISRIGIAGLLVVCAVLLVSCMTCMVLVARRERAGSHVPAPERKPGKRKIRVATDSSRLLSSRYLRWLTLMITVTFLTCPLIDYQWKVMAREAYPDRVAFAGFLGSFYTLSGAASFLFQILLTRIILKRFGIFGALLVLPGFIGLGTVCNLTLPSLLAVSLAKGSENTFRYTINDSSLALLYMTIPAHQRGKVKTFVEGIVKNWAIAAAGLLLALVITPLLPDARQLSFVLLVPLAAWFACLVGLKREYLPMLLASLKQRRFERDEIGLVVDERTAGLIRTTLTSGDEEEVLRALDLVRPLDILRWEEPVKALLGHASARVRIAVIEALAGAGVEAHAAVLEPAFADPDEAVRVAAIAGFCTLRRMESIHRVRPLLADERPAVRAAAVTGLLRYGGLDGVLCAAEELKRLIEHPRAEMRAHAARVLGASGVRNFYQPLYGLLADPAPEVRSAAIRAAAELRPPELIPALVAALAARPTTLVASEALAAYQAGVEPALEEVLSRPGADVEHRVAAAGCLARIASGEACAVLVRALARDAEAPVRHRVQRSLNRVVSQHPELRPDRAPIRRACRAEDRPDLSARIELALHASELAQDALLKEALETRRATMLGGVFHLLNVLHPEGRFSAVHDNLRSTNRATRAQAIEVIDTVVERGLREHVLNLVEARSVSEQLDGRDAAEAAVRLPPASPLNRLLAHESPWIVAASLGSLARRYRQRSAAVALDEVKRAAAAAGDRPSPLVRQTALWLMASVAPTDPELVRRARVHAEAEDLELRDFARATLETMAGNVPAEVA